MRSFMFLHLILMVCVCVWTENNVCVCVCMCAQDCCAWRTLPEGNQAILCKSLWSRSGVQNVQERGNWSHDTTYILVTFNRSNKTQSQPSWSIWKCQFVTVFIVIVPAQQDKRCCLSSVWVMIICWLCWHLAACSLLDIFFFWYGILSESMKLIFKNPLQRPLVCRHRQFVYSLTVCKSLIISNI